VIKIEKKDVRNDIIKHIKIYYEMFLNIKKNNIPISGKKYDENELISVVDALLEGHWTEGKYTEEFEKKFCKYLNIDNTIVVNSGSSANLLALKCLTSSKLNNRKLNPGDEIITVETAFPTTVNPIIQCGCVPVFCDVDLQTYNINIEQLKKAITSKTKAVILAHTLGNPFNLKTITRLCKYHGLWLIEDNCDALGSKYNNKYTGTFGDISTFSFYPAHHITMGEGGAVCTNNNMLAKIIRCMRDWGRDCICKTGQDNMCGHRYDKQHGELPFGYDHKYVYSEIGYNLKNTDLNVAIGLAQLDKLEKFNRIRRENFKLLRNKLSEYTKFFHLPKAQMYSDPAWFGFLLTIKDNKLNREELLKHLNKNGIGTRLLFTGNIIMQPYFKNIKYRVVGELYNTNQILNNTFWIGINQLIDKEDINKIVDVIDKFLEGRY